MARAQRNTTSGDLAETSAIQAGLTLGLGYDVALSPVLALRPQATWTHLDLHRR